MLIKKISIAICLAIFILVLPSYAEGESEVVSKTEREYPKFHFLQIEKAGVEDLAPGIGIEISEGKTRYYTVSHWFEAVKYPDRHRVHTADKIYPLVKVNYIGNDLVELFLGEESDSNSPELYGVAPTGYGRFDINASVTGIEPFYVQPAGPSRRMTCFGSYETDFGGYENRHGFVCDPGERTIGDGDSGSALIDKISRVFLVSGFADREVEYQLDGKAKITSQMVFVQPLLWNE